MKPLIEIQSIPISIEFKITPAKIQRSDKMAEVEITRKSNGGLRIQSKPIKLNIDTFEARNSVTPSPARSIAQAAAKGREAGYQATADFAARGKMLLDIHLDQDPFAQIAEAKMPTISTEMEMRFIPEYPAEISWDPGNIQINYEIDKLNFDWKTNQREFEFIPGDIEFTVTQYPKVVIKYVGDPIYVPPSSAPNYTPIDTKG